jgi:hypothetical protein
MGDLWTIREAGLGLARHVMSVSYASQARW